LGSDQTPPRNTFETFPKKFFVEIRKLPAPKGGVFCSIFVKKKIVGRPGLKV